MTEHSIDRELLEKISQEDGECEQQYLGPNRTAGQILVGGVGFVLMIVKSVAFEWHVRHFLKILLGLLSTGSWEKSI